MRKDKEKLIYTMPENRRTPSPYPFPGEGIGGWGVIGDWNTRTKILILTRMGDIPTIYAVLFQNKMYVYASIP